MDIRAVSSIGARNLSSAPFTWMRLGLCLGQWMLGDDMKEFEGFMLLIGKLSFLCDLTNLQVLDLWDTPGLCAFQCKREMHPFGSHVKINVRRPFEIAWWKVVPMSQNVIDIIKWVNTNCSSECMADAISTLSPLDCILPELSTEVFRTCLEKSWCWDREGR